MTHDALFQARDYLMSGMRESKLETGLIGAMLKPPGGGD